MGPLVVTSSVYEGYQDVQLDMNTYKVVYWWNTGTSEQRGQDLMLYRCADLTVQRGFDYFVILDDRGGARVIRMFHGVRPDDASNALDARALMTIVGARFGLQSTDQRS